MAETKKMTQKRTLQGKNSKETFSALGSSMRFIILSITFVVCLYCIPMVIAIFMKQVGCSFDVDITGQYLTREVISMNSASYGAEEDNYTCKSLSIYAVVHVIVATFSLILMFVQIFG